ncbi:MAG: glycosyl transferase group 1 [Ferruginibacter sp.]|nr:glycosyl transferase group 1 [Ferruginibacter sp.]
MGAIYFTVTTNLSFDQRMIRICSSLSAAGYEVVLVGRNTPGSPALLQMPYRQERLRCFFHKGKLFYAEYNLRLFFFLLTKKMSAICAIDLDTILPVLWTSRLKKIPRVYDAHELFCEMKEIVTRPNIHRVWKWIEQKSVPHFRHGYTVNSVIAEEFKRMYGRSYEVIRSIAVYRPELQQQTKENFILYQGAINEGRSFETIIPAMQWVNAPLYLCGDGNFMEQAKELVRKYGLADKVIFRGLIQPEALREITARAKIGLTIFENNGLSNYFSLANRFFDYVHAGVPQLCVDFPVYRELNNSHEIAVLIEDLSPENIAEQLNSMLADEGNWRRLHNNCLQAAKEWNWEEEEKKLLAFYKQLIG